MHFRVQPHKNLTEILLLNDNARPHTSLKTLEAITKFGWTVLPHPPYSPNLAPSDSQPFGALKDAIHSMKFETDGNVTHTLRTWLCEQDKAWYR
jgi:histone-lysine N-methyltransferase SETMAR